MLLKITLISGLKKFKKFCWIWVIIQELALQLSVIIPPLAHIHLDLNSHIYWEFLVQLLLLLEDYIPDQVWIFDKLIYFVNFADYGMGILVLIFMFENWKNKVYILCLKKSKTQHLYKIFVSIFYIQIRNVNNNLHW